MFDTAFRSEDGGVKVDLQVKGLPVTIFQDCVSIFVNIKPVMIVADQCHSNICMRDTNGYFKGDLYLSMFGSL